MKKIIFILVAVVVLGLACGDGSDSSDDYREVDATPICISDCD